MGSKMGMRDGEDRAWAPCTRSRSPCTAARHQTQMKNASKHDATYTQSRTASRRNGLESQEKNLSLEAVTLTALCITPVGQDTWKSPHFLLHRIHQEHGWLSHWSDCSQSSMRALLPPTSSFQRFLSLSSYVQGHQRGHRLESRAAINPSPADFGSLIFSPASLCIIIIAFWSDRLEGSECRSLLPRRSSDSGLVRCGIARSRPASWLLSENELLQDGQYLTAHKKANGALPCHASS